MAFTPSLSGVHKTNKLAGLDHLRALAITLVFFFHYRLFAHPVWIDQVVGFMWTGVDLFFVLSGYLIATQVFQKVSAGDFSWSEFFIKRFFKIIPPYLAVLTLYFCIPAFREWEGLPSLWRFLTFTQNFGLDTRCCRTFSHAWSLCVEEQFYFFFPLIVMAGVFLKTGSKSFYLALVLFLFGFAIRAISWNYLEPLAGTNDFMRLWFRNIYYPTYNRLDGLLTGVCIAGLFHFFPRVKRYTDNKGNAILILGLGVAGIAYFLCLDFFSFKATVFGFPCVAIAYGLLVVSAVSPTSVLYKIKSKLTFSIATLSYSIYLSHKAAIHFAQQQFSGLGLESDSTLMFFVCMIVSVLAGAVLYACIEKPFLLLRNIILRKRAATKLPAVVMVSTMPEKL